MVEDICFVRSLVVISTHIKEEEQKKEEESCYGLSWMESRTLDLEGRMGRLVHMVVVKDAFLALSSLVG